MRQHHAGFAFFACLFAVTVLFTRADAFEWLGARRDDMDQGARAMVVVGNRAYVACGPAGVAVVDVARPTATEALAVIDTPGGASRLDLSGELLVVADGGTGVVLLDVSDPTRPRLRAT